MRVCLIGQPNVGKSTLFNRLIGYGRSIVTDIAGTTTEQVIQPCVRDDQYISLVDTPGRDETVEDMAVLFDLYDADIFVFVCDAKQGMTGREQEMTRLLHDRGLADRTVVVVNKCDTPADDALVHEYAPLGFGQTIATSARNKRHIEAVRQMIIEIGQSLPQRAARIPDVDAELVIVGRPNVGKSTLANTISGQYLSQVSEIAGTTRDYISHQFVHDDQTIRIYDTVGQRKKGKMPTIEKLALHKVQTLIGLLHPTVIFLIDAAEGLTHTDTKLLGQMLRLQSPIVIGLNKADEASELELANLQRQLQRQFGWIPTVPISGKTGRGLTKLMDAALSLRTRYTQTITTGSLNRTITEQLIARPPRFPKNKICKCYYMVQKSTGPQHFLVFINKKSALTSAYRRRLENSLRRTYDLVGVPISFSFVERKRQQRHERHLSKDELAEREARKAYEARERKRQAKKEGRDRQPRRR